MKDRDKTSFYCNLNMVKWMYYVCLLSPRNALSSGHLEINKHKQEWVQDSASTRNNMNYNENEQGNIIKGYEHRTERTFEWMEWIEWMNYTSAYTGIACDTPVSDHLGLHLTKCRDPRPVWRTFHTGIQLCPHWSSGSYVPMLELMGLISTPVENPWTMNEWNETWIMKDILSFNMD